MHQIIKKRLLIVRTLILLVVGLSGWACTPGSEATEGPLRVVATTGMVADLVQEIGGDSLQVTALMGPGVDPHLYKATQGDLVRLRAADVIFYNGLHLEGKMGEVFEKLAAIKQVVAIGESLPPSQLLQDPVYQENFDPHIWFDVSLWAATIDGVVEALSEADPESSAYFRTNAEQYREELEELHQWVRSRIDRLPVEKRILVTAHDAFNYFGRAYGIDVRGLQGISTLSEFGLKDRVDLVDFLVEKEIKAVFVETSVSEKNINSIVEGCRQKGHEIRIGGSLYSDAMGDPGTPAGTYLGMVRANVNTIVDALQ